eukprot:556556-Hanusia_phi.AAC.5
MISGAAQADAAILVIDGSTGEFESGFHSGGQTVEHAILVRVDGGVRRAADIEIDNVDYSKERYEQIQDELSRFLVKAGFRSSDWLQWGKFVAEAGCKADCMVGKLESV